MNWWVYVYTDLHNLRWLLIDIRRNVNFTFYYDYLVSHLSSCNLEPRSSLSELQFPENPGPKS